jgi:hypothetical protein
MTDSPTPVLYLDLGPLISTAVGATAPDAIARAIVEAEEKEK